MGGGASPDPFPVGLRTFGVWEPLTGERFDFSVWYPSRIPSSENILEGWVVAAGKRGRIVSGFFPVVLLSHDTAGGRFAHNDIAAALASGGMIVIAPTHSGDNQNSSSGLYKVETLHTRPQNMLRALETVLGSPDFAPHADESRIGLLGVGAGAITALQLAGAVPDFSHITAYCRNAPEDDAYCTPWGEKRLALIDAEMKGVMQKRGTGAYAPPLDLLAPELISVPVPPELLRPPAEDAGRKPGLWQRLFGDDVDEEGDAETVVAPQAEPHAPDAAHPVDIERERDGEAMPGNVTEGEAQDAENGAAAASAERGAAAAGGPNITGTTSTAGASNPAAQASPPKAGAGLYPEEPVRKPKTVDGTIIFHRPAALRTLRGIVLVAPAGGMLFSREALASVAVPVAVVEAGKDSLYPPEYHSAPYVSRLPLLPLRLRLDRADHFSLFAGCSADTMNTLSAICGRVVGDEREALAKERDAFIVPFFQSVLGGPLSVPPPSGLAAVAPLDVDGR